MSPKLACLGAEVIVRRNPWVAERLRQSSRTGTTTRRYMLGRPSVANRAAAVPIPRPRSGRGGRMLYTSTVPFHVRIWPTSAPQQALGELYAFNLAREDLEARFAQPYRTGGSITWGGRTLS